MKEVEESEADKERKVVIKWEIGDLEHHVAIVESEAKAATKKAQILRTRLRHLKDEIFTINYENEQKARDVW